MFTFSLFVFILLTNVSLQHPWLNGMSNEDLVLESFIEEALDRIKNGIPEEEPVEDSDEEYKVILH